MASMKEWLKKPREFSFILGYNEETKILRVITVHYDYLTVAVSIIIILEIVLLRYLLICKHG